MTDKARLTRLLLFGTGVFNVVDYFVTLRALEMGFVEGNPVMSVIVGTVYFTKVKLVVVPLLLVLVWVYGRRIGKRLCYYAGGVFVAYGGLMGYFAWLMWMGYL